MRQLSRKEKEAAILSVIVLLGIGGFSYVTADSMQVAEPATALHEETAEAHDEPAELAKKERQKNVELPQDITLRNPFSMVHETREEAAAAEQTNAVMPILTTEDVASYEVDSADAAVQRAQEGQQRAAVAGQITALTERAEEKPILCGVVQGNGERLALIRLDKHTQSVGIGEWIGDFEVVAILADRVCLQRNGEQQWLSLQYF